MASLWGKLKSLAKSVTGGNLIRRLPKTLQTLAKTSETLSRRTRPTPIRPSEMASPRWSPQPPGPTLEPPIAGLPQQVIRDLAVPPPPSGPVESSEYLDRVADTLSRMDWSKMTPEQKRVADRLDSIVREYQRQQRAAEVEPDDEEGEMIETLGRGPLGYEEGLSAALMNKTIRTPTSSNVYSFVYVSAEETDMEGTMFSPQEAARKAKAERQLKTGSWRGPYRGSHLYGTLAGGILYVTFKLWQPGQKGERPNQPGPTYAYYDVPLRKFNAFFDRASESPGGAVWDYLRVRGTRHGHQQPYRLVFGAQVPAGGRLVQRGGVYVPRKATAKGFVTRSLPGRRGLVTSQLGTATAAQRKAAGRTMRR